MSDKTGYWARISLTLMFRLLAPHYDTSQNLEEDWTSGLKGHFFFTSPLENGVFTLIWTNPLLPVSSLLQVQMRDNHAVPAPLVAFNYTVWWVLSCSHRPHTLSTSHQFTVVLTILSLLACYRSSLQMFVNEYRDLSITHCSLGQWLVGKTWLMDQHSGKGYSWPLFHP